MYEWFACGLDNLVQISHNDRIGKNNYIIGHCCIAGSVIIGDNCWIAAERILNKVTVGNNVFILARKEKR